MGRKKKANEWDIRCPDCNKADSVDLSDQKYYMHLYYMLFNEEFMSAEFTYICNACNKEWMVRRFYKFQGEELVELDGDGDFKG